MTQLMTRPTEEELDALNREIGAAGPEAVLEWALRYFGPKIALACSFGGVSGMVLLDMAIKISPALEVFYLDTGFLFPETLALRDEVARRYGIAPQAFRPALTPQAQAARYGTALWERDPDQCCAIRKVEPNRRALEGLDAWIVGLRRDQTDHRKAVQAVEWDAKFNLYKISPLWDWTQDMVWTYIQAHDVPYNPLHDQGYPSLGCTNCTRPVAAGDDLRAGRWSGTSKTECGLHK